MGRLIISRVRNAPAWLSILLFIALLIICNSLAGALFGYTPKSFPSPFRELSFLQNPYLSRHETGTIIVALALFGALYIFFSRTRLGLAMRAAAHHEKSAGLSGIPVHWMTAFGGGVAAGIGSLAVFGRAQGGEGGSEYVEVIE